MSSRVCCLVQGEREGSQLHRLAGRCQIPIDRRRTHNLQFRILRAVDRPIPVFEITSSRILALSRFEASA